MADFSTAAVIRRGGRYLVAKRLPGGSMGGRWEFPGGKAEAGESPEQALEREFLEEFAVPITVGEHLVSTTFRNNGKNYRLLAFSAELGEGRIELKEHEEIRWLLLEEIEALDLADSDREIYRQLRELK